jgi:transposase-like protein
VAKKRVGKFPKSFRQYAVARLKQCDNIVALSKELGVHRRLLYTWRDQLEPAESGLGAGHDAGDTFATQRVAPSDCRSTSTAQGRCITRIEAFSMPPVLT